MDPAQSGAASPGSDAWWRIFDPRHSLRARAVLIFGGGALVFTLLLTGIAGAIFRREVESRLGPSFENLAFQIGDKIDRGIYERVRALQFTATLAPFRAADTPVNERRAMLDALLNSAPEYAWVGFVEPGGQVVCATQRWLEEAQVGGQPWFHGALSGPYIGSPHEYPELNRLISHPGEETAPRFLDLAVPVMDSRGKILGILGAQVRWTLAREAQLSVVPETAIRERLGATVYAAAGDMLLDSGATGGTEPPPPPPVGDRSGIRGSLTENIDGGDWLTGYARTHTHREYRSLNWLVTVRQPVAEAFKSVGEFRNRIIRIGLIASLTAAGLSWFVAGRFARRTNAVAKAADRIREGDILALLPLPHGRDEFQKMCTALGAMVEQLRQQQDSSPPDENPPASNRKKHRNRARPVTQTRLIGILPRPNSRVCFRCSCRPTAPPL